MKLLQLLVPVSLCGAVALAACANEGAKNQASREAELMALRETKIQFYQGQGYTYQQAVMMAEEDMEKLRLRQQLTSVLEDARATRPNAYHGEGQIGLRYQKRYNR